MERNYACLYHILIRNEPPSPFIPPPPKCPNFPILQGSHTSAPSVISPESHGTPHGVLGGEEGEGHGVSAGLPAPGVSIVVDAGPGRGLAVGGL